ncbi:MAG: cation transporter [Promethearchaeota archaeon]
MASVALTFTCAHLLRVTASSTGSPALDSEARQVRADGYSSLAVLGGMIVIYLGWGLLDVILALGISALVVFSGAGIFWRCTAELLDRGLEPDKKREIVDAIEALELAALAEVREVRGRRAGRHVFLEIGVDIAPKVSSGALQREFEEVKGAIRHKFPEVELVAFIPHFLTPTHLKFAVPVSEDLGLESPISPHFGKAPKFAFVDVPRGWKRREGIRDESPEPSGTLVVVVEDNPHVSEEKRVGILVSEWLVSRGVDIVLLREDLHEGPKFVLRNADVRVYHVPVASLGEVDFERHATATT